MVRTPPGLGYASVQRGEPGRSALEQHWAQAVVLAPDLVLVPDPPEADDRELVGAHLLVAERRVAIRGLELLVLEGRQVCGVALLAEPVEDRGRHTTPSDPSPLVEALRKEGTIWPVLLELVPDGSGPGSDPARFLEGLPGGLPGIAVLRPPRRIELPDAERVGKSICWWVPWCQPDGPP